MEDCAVKDDHQDELFVRFDERCIVRGISGDEERGPGYPERKRSSSRTSTGEAKEGSLSLASGMVAAVQRKFWMEE